MMDKDKYYELIVKELSDDITDGEKILLEKENSEDLVQAQKYSIIKTFWNHFYPPHKTHNIIGKTEKKLGFTYRNKAKINIGFAIKIAASILVILSLGFSVYQIIKPKQDFALNEYSCASGKVKEIVLSDGTHVWLNSTSQLFASEPFLGKTRMVKLVGEAYFEVAHNPEQPFIVKSYGIQTKVLGTHFNVAAYPGDKKHEVSLFEGKVEINAQNNTTSKIYLTPGKKATFSPKTGIINVTDDAGQPAVWRDGVLRFYDEDFNSICQKLERKFQTKIIIADSNIGDLHFTANFDVEPLTKILDLLKKAHNFNYIKTNNGIIIESKTNIKKSRMTTS